MLVNSRNVPPMRATRNLALIPKENPPEQIKDLTRTPQKNSLVTREAKRKVQKKKCHSTAESARESKKTKPKALKTELQESGKTKQKKHANVEDSDSLQFAIRNLNSTLMTLQKDVEELKNSKPASEPAPAKIAVVKESFPQFPLPQPDAGLIPQQLMLMHQNPSSASLLQ